MQLRETDLNAGRKLGEAIVAFLASIEFLGRDVKPIVSEIPTSPRSSPVPATASTKQYPTALLVSPREAAKLLSISERSLWGLTSPRGPIPAIHLGRLVRYSIDDLKSTIATLKNNG
jgi:hypothetical protein